MCAFIVYRIDACKVLKHTLNWCVNRFGACTDLVCTDFKHAHNWHVWSVYRTDVSIVLELAQNLRFNSLDVWAESWQEVLLCTECRVLIGVQSQMVRLHLILLSGSSAFTCRWSWSSVSSSGSGRREWHIGYGWTSCPTPTMCWFSARTSTWLAKFVSGKSKRNSFLSCSFFSGHRRRWSRFQN